MLEKLKLANSLSIFPLLLFFGLESKLFFRHSGSLKVLSFCLIYCDIEAVGIDLMDTEVQEVDITDFQSKFVSHIQYHIARKLAIK